MKNILFVILLCSISFSVLAQVKIVKIPNENFYLNFFYQKQKSDYVKNDSTSYFCRKISVDSFFLDKVVNKKIQWTRQYVVGQDKDSLIVYMRHTGSKVVKRKQEYFIAQQMSK